MPFQGFTQSSAKWFFFHMPDQLHGNVCQGTEMSASLCLNILDTN